MRSVTSLRGRRAFEAVRTGGRVYRGEHFRFFYDLTKGLKSNIRIGTVVGKRYGSAVCRNVLKRRMREACRRFTNPLEEKLGAGQLTLSVVAVHGGWRPKPAARISFDEIMDDVAGLVRAIQTLESK